MRALVGLTLCAVVCGCSSVDREKVAREDSCRGVIQRWQIFVEDLDRAADGGYELSAPRSAAELSLQQWMVAELQLADACWPEIKRKAGEPYRSTNHARLLKELELAIVRGDLVTARERARAIAEMIGVLVPPKR